MKTAVALVFFNRLEPLKKVVARLCEIKPPKVYLISDGPRVNRKDEKDKVAACRRFMEILPWKCEVVANFSKANLGCSDRIYTGLNWVFAQEERAIIIEDDCIPEPVFFAYAEEMLERFKNDNRIMSVCGFNPAAAELDFGSDVVLSRYPMVWGWATWRRAWNKMDYSLVSAKGVNRLWLLWRRLGGLRPAIYWQYILSRPAPSWDYRWSFTSFFNYGLHVLPSRRIIDNVGMTPDSTHTATNPYSLPPVNHNWAFCGKMPRHLDISDETLDKWIEDHIYSRSSKERLAWLWKKFCSRFV